MMFKEREKKKVGESFDEFLDEHFEDPESDILVEKQVKEGKKRRT